MPRKPTCRKGARLVADWAPVFGFQNFRITVTVLPEEEKGKHWGLSSWNIEEEWAHIQLVPDGVLPDDVQEQLVLHELAHGLIDLATKGEAELEVVCNRIARFFGGPDVQSCNEWNSTQEQDAWAANSMDQRWVKLLVDGLPDDERRVVNALYYEGQTFRSLAAEMGKSTRSIGRLRDRAVARLTEGMEQVQ